MTPGSRALREFHREEAAVFARYGLAPRSRVLRPARTGVSIRSLDIGGGDPVLFIHGISLCSAHWASLMARLPGWRCVALEMPGHGGSSAKDHTGIDLRAWYSALLRGCLDELGLDSVHVVGHSYGGLFALWLALDAPARVRSVVVVGAPAVGFDGRPDASLRMLATPVVGMMTLTAPSPLFVYRRALARALGGRAVSEAPPELVRATHWNTRLPGFPRTATTYLREQFRGQRATPQQYVVSDAELARVEQPALVVWGDQDTRFEPVAEGEAKTRMMPRGSFALVPGGHEPWLDDAEPCARAVGDFLRAAG